MSVYQNVLDQMTTYLRQKDKEMAVNPGSPETNILETVAMLIDAGFSQIKIYGTIWDIDSKSGSELDQFLALFGFLRKQGTEATGTISFLRNDDKNVLKNYAIVPSGTVVTGQNGLKYITIEEGHFNIGQSKVTLPAKCQIIGEAGNTPINSVTTPSAGLLIVQRVTNEVPFENGTDVESDYAFRNRFRNQFLRSLAGTADYYLALSLAPKSSRRSRIIGPWIFYDEQLQIENLYSALSKEGFSSDQLNTWGVSKNDIGAISSIGYLGIANEIRVENVELSDSSSLSNGHRYTQGAKKDFSFRTFNISTDFYTGGDYNEPPFTRKGCFVKIESANAKNKIPVGSTVSLQFQYNSTANRSKFGSWFEYEDGEKIRCRGMENRVDIYTDGSEPYYMSETGDLNFKYFESSDQNHPMYYKKYKFPNGEHPIPGPQGHKFIEFGTSPINIPPLSLNIEGNSYYLEQGPERDGQKVRLRAIRPDGLPLFNNTGWDHGIANLVADINGNVSIDGHIAPDTKTGVYTCDFLVEDPSFNFTIVSHTVNIIVDNVNHPAGSWMVLSNGGYGRKVNHGSYIEVDNISPVKGSQRERSGIAFFPGEVTPTQDGIPFTFEYNYDRLPRAIDSILTPNKQISTDVCAHAAEKCYIAPSLVVQVMNNVVFANIKETIQNAVVSYFQNAPFGMWLEKSDICRIIANIDGVDQVRFAEKNDMDKTREPVFWGIFSGGVSNLPSDTRLPPFDTGVHKPMVGDEASVNNKANSYYIHAITGYKIAWRKGHYSDEIGNYSIKIMEKDQQTVKYHIPDGVENYRLKDDAIPVLSDIRIYLRSANTFSSRANIDGD